LRVYKSLIVLETAWSFGVYWRWQDSRQSKKKENMAEDHIRYDILTREALRGVVRKVLSEVAKTGLPGNHHFFITFATRAPGVRISNKLIQQYEKEMTIVLQHRFWDLKVTDTGFEVGLSFDDQPEILIIPFNAVLGFFDPSVEFGLKFEPFHDEDTEDGQETASAADDEKTPALQPVESESGTGEDAGDKPEGTGEKVISLDSFRKKT
jgi:hypothetical protein